MTGCGARSPIDLHNATLFTQSHRQLNKRITMVKIYMLLQSSAILLFDYYFCHFGVCATQRIGVKILKFQTSGETIRYSILASVHVTSAKHTAYQQLSKASS